MKKDVFANIYKKVWKSGTTTLPGVFNEMKIVYSCEFYYEGSVKPIAYDKNSVFCIAEGSESTPGIVHALRTMKIGEVAVFWIPSHLIFRKGDMILKIKLISAKAYESKNKSPQEQFQDTMAKMFMLKQEAIHTMHHHKHCNVAVGLFKRMITTLEIISAANEVSNEQCIQLLKHAYLSSAECYLELDDFKNVCNMIKRLKQLVVIKKNQKALYLKGMAMIGFDDIGRARSLLQKALRLNPRELKVRKALEMLKLKEDEKRLQKVRDLIALEESQAAIQKEKEEQEEKKMKEIEKERLLSLEIDKQKSLLRKKVHDFLERIKNTELDYYELIDFKIKEINEIAYLSSEFSRSGFILKSMELANQQVFFIQKL